MIFHYNQQGLLDGVTSSLGTYLDQTATSFNAAGQPMALKLGNGKSIDFTYYADLRLSTLGVSPGAVLGLSFPTYDEKRQVKTITDTVMGGQTTLQYDDFDRLQGAGGQQSSTYGYDSIGNMTVKTEGQAGGPGSAPETACSDYLDSDGDTLTNDGCTTSYSRLCYSPQQSGCAGVASGRPHAVKTATGINPSFTYNPNFTATQTYDPAGNLLSVSGNNGTGGSAGSLGLLLRLEHLNEGYDAEGRLRKVEYNKLDYGTDLAFYDVDDDCDVDATDVGMIGNSWPSSVGETGYNPRYDLNSNGSVDLTDVSAATGMLDKTCPKFTYDSAGQLIKLEGPKNKAYIGGIFEKDLDTQEVTKYYFGPDGRRIAMRKGGALYYFAQDHLGGTALVMNASGGVVSRMGYYPYGMTWTEQGAMPTDRLYTGQQRFGAKSGMYNYVSRFYSADMGRFPQPDSILPNVYEPQALSRYTYVGNNPTNYTDPTGHFAGGGVFPVPDFGGGCYCSPLPPPGFDDDSVPAPKPGGGDASSATVTPWPLPWLPLPAYATLPVSGASACAPRIACCYMGGYKYVCGTWGSDPGGGGGGLLSFLKGVAGGVLDVIGSDCFLAVVSTAGLLATTYVAGTAGVVFVQTSWTVTYTVQGLLATATATGLVASGALGGTPYDAVDTVYTFAEGTVSGWAGCVD